MYKELRFDAILERMLKRVAAKYDKREGSVIWDALAPASVEFQNFYVILQGVLMEMFADTATRNFLIKHCAERGISPKPASAAIVKGQFTPATVNVPIGSRFSHEDFNYTVTSKISDGLYYLTCESVGSEANEAIGRLVPIEYLSGLQTAEIVDVVVLGEDDEPTESLRARYFSSINAEAFGGNKRDYVDKIMSIGGVGAVKVYSGAKWNGGGTVRCVIVDSNFEVPDQKLIDDIQLEIDPELMSFDGSLSNGTRVGLADDGSQYNIGSGEGEGWAPIGHIVTIMGAYGTPVNITTEILYRNGFSWETVKNDVENVVDEYLHELNQQWSNTDAIRVRISQLESRILNVNGVLDIRDTMLNGKAENLTVNEDSIVTRGTINARS